MNSLIVIFKQLFVRTEKYIFFLKEQMADADLWGAPVNKLCQYDMPYAKIHKPRKEQIIEFEMPLFISEAGKP